jgi:hypothetical protein
MNAVSVVQIVSFDGDNLQMHDWQGLFNVQLRSGMKRLTSRGPLEWAYCRLYSLDAIVSLEVMALASKLARDGRKKKIEAEKG